MIKILIFVAVFLWGFTPLSQSQTFTSSVQLGQGFRFIDYHTPQFYMAYGQASFGIKVIEKASISAVSRVDFCDGNVDIYAGNQVDYGLFDSQNWQLSIQGSALFGSRGRQLFGGGATIGNPPFFITINARQEYSNKELYFDGGVIWRFSE